MAQGLLCESHIFSGTCFEDRTSPTALLQHTDRLFDNAGKNLRLQTWLKSLFSVSALWVSQWQDTW